MPRPKKSISNMNSHNTETEELKTKSLQHTNNQYSISAT